MFCLSFVRFSEKELFFSNILDVSVTKLFVLACGIIITKKIKRQKCRVFRHLKIVSLSSNYPQKSPWDFSRTFFQWCLSAASDDALLMMLHFVQMYGIITLLYLVGVITMAKGRVYISCCPENPPDWYWTSGLHDACVLDVEYFEYSA